MGIVALALLAAALGSRAVYPIPVAAAPAPVCAAPVYPAYYGGYWGGPLVYSNYHHRWLTVG